MRTGNALRPWTRLSASRRFQWRLLLAYRMGLIEPEPVELPPLEDAIERDCRAAHFFALWWGLRRAVEPDLADTAFSVTFVVDALGISRPQAGLAIKALANGLGVLEKTGELDPVGRRKHGTRFYRPKLRAVPAAGNRL
jgi:hypothetical protein